MTGHAELELAIAHLLRTKELAAFFGWPEEHQKRIDLLFRGACDLKKQISFSTAIHNRENLSTRNTTNSELGRD